MIFFDESKGKIHPNIKKLFRKGLINKRKVFPGSFNCQDIWKEHEPMYERFEVETRRKLESRLREMNAVLLKAPWGVDGDHLEAEFYPIQTDFPLEHSARFDRYDFERYQSIIEQIYQTRVIGDPDTTTPTYLKLQGFGEDHDLILGGGGFRLIVDTKQLLTLRNLFYDPEGVLFKREFKKTFLVFGGIPVQTVKIVKGSSYTDLQVELKESGQVY